MGNSIQPQIHAATCFGKGTQSWNLHRTRSTFALSGVFIHMLKLPNRVKQIEMNLLLTCWPLDAIGVDLNSQNQQKGAGVHRVAVLVHFKCVEEIISFTP